MVGIKNIFEQIFTQGPEAIAVAPGRVNLIGEHTDYNQGFVLPVAIDHSIKIAFRRRTDQQIHVHSLNYNESVLIEEDNLGQPSAGWVEYLKAVIEVLQQAGVLLRGWDGVIAGDVPIGAGLSSSAAFEMAVARVCVELAGTPWDPLRIAILAQKAENERIGVQSGIMDQLACGCAQAGHALLLDCRNLRIEQIAFPQDVVIVVMDTTTRRQLAGSGYNQVRQRCRFAAEFLRLSSLRDLTLDELQKETGRMEAEIYRCARHVVTENQRTLAAAEALKNHDVGQMGKLMNQSHASLRDDLKVSSSELDIMVEISQEQPGCFGARMTGAGFGGCAIALVSDREEGDFLARVTEEFQKATKIQASIFPCRTAEGVHLSNTASA
jgi:galactokinase